MQNAPVKIIQLSDTHLLANEEDALLGVNTQQSFTAVINVIKHENDRPDFFLLSGDISQDGSDVSYKRVANLLKSFEVPVYWVPGNHDDNKVMLQVFPLETISNHKHIVLKNWHLILLNSQIPEAVPGLLDRSQLNYLQHCLQTYPEHQAIIVFHHPPLPIKSAWMDDKLGLQNAKEFWDIIAHYPKVNSVLFGHVHQVFEQILNKVKCYSAPSTCFQFSRQQEKFGLEKLPPGYRWIHLYEDGHLETGVRRAAEYVGHFQESAQGY